MGLQFPDSSEKTGSLTLAPTEVDLHSAYDNIVSSDTTMLGVQWEPKTDRIHYAQWPGGGVQRAMKTP